MALEIRSLDREIFAHSLQNFLPQQIIDIHAHIWLKSFVRSAPADTRYALSGGSHHQAIAYGSHTTKLQKLAMLLNIPCIVI